MEWLKNFKMSNEVYDVLKWIVITASPALVWLITTLGAIYGFDPAKVTGTISALTTFVGLLIGISSIKYAKKAQQEAETGDSEQ